MGLAISQLYSDSMIGEQEEIMKNFAKQRSEETKEEKKQVDKEVLEVKWVTAETNRPGGQVHASESEAIQSYLDMTLDPDMMKAVVLCRDGKVVKSHGETQLINSLTSQEESMHETPTGTFEQVDPEKLINNLKRKFQHNQVFIHRCSACLKYGSMLHSSFCVLCGQPNEYFDEVLEVDPSIHDQVTAELIKIEQGNVAEAPEALAPDFSITESTGDQTQESPVT